MSITPKLSINLPCLILMALFYNKKQLSNVIISMKWCLILIPSFLFGQNNNSYFFTKDTQLAKQAFQIITASTTEMRVKEAFSLQQNLVNLLQEEGSFLYDFDSLRNSTVSVIKPTDNKFKLYSFNAVGLDQKFYHFGVLQYQKNKNTIEVVSFFDTISEFKKTILDEQLGTTDWFGALYYQVQTVKKWFGKPRYVLIGFDGATSAINRKVIDVLSFDNEEPVFGLPMFKEGDFDPSYECRVVMESHNEVYQGVRFIENKKDILFEKLKEAYNDVAGDSRYAVNSGEYDIYVLNKKGKYMHVISKDYDFGQGSGVVKPLRLEPDF